MSKQSDIQKGLEEFDIIIQGKDGIRITHLDKHHVSGILAYLQSQDVVIKVGTRNILSSEPITLNVIEPLIGEP